MALIFAITGPNWSVDSVVQSCLTLCDPMNYTTQGFSVHNQLLELTQIHVHWVDDAIQPSHPLSSPSPPAFNLSQQNWYIHSNNWYIHLKFQIIVNKKCSNSLKFFFSYKKSLVMAQEMHKQSSNKKVQNSEHFSVVTNILLLQKE